MPLLTLQRLLELTHRYYREHTCFHRVAEVYFPSMQALEACLHATGGQETLEHAVEISTGGTLVFLTAEVGCLDL
jgi:hypothetical protein